MNSIIRNREQGAVAPLVGILMVVFILCVALVVDLGHLHNVKVQLQRAADAAALAGAQQLDGSTSQDDNATAVARATAAVNRVNAITGLVADGGWVDNTSVIIDLGSWDPDITATDRFSSPVDAGTANAIKVTAEVYVDYFFFLFGSGSTVTADAIAVNKYEETALPIALLSCVPLDAVMGGVGDTVCDIELYKFNNDTDDTAGWTALTYDINAAQLKYFFTEEGNAIVNEIIYGTGDGHGGLENYQVKEGDGTYGDVERDIPCGDDNVELDIKCGLGPDFAAPSSPPTDPFNYVLNGDDSLPRWEDDAFKRIWSMDGILLQNYVPGETDAEYETRLDALRDASNSNDYTTYENTYHSLETHMKDGRFSELIDDKDGVALFDEALRYAGYPEIQAKNGADNAVIQAFIDLSTEPGHFKDSLTKINEPLDATGASDSNNSYGGGDSFAVTIPVIFAGVCGEWKALKGKYYIGTANLLITRIWQNQNACYDASEPVTVFGSPPCTIGDLTPQLGGASGNNYECVTGAGSGAQAGIEALITPRGEEGPSGIQKIYLVE